jgi:hypothetical protein
MRDRMRLAAWVLLLLSPVAANAQQESRKTAMPPRGPVGAQDDGSLALQRERLELDRQKLASDHQIEERRLQLEQEKLEAEKSTGRISAISSMVPLLVGLGTLIYGVWSFRKQAQLQFETKAAELAFSGKTPEAVANRAKALKKIFPKRLPGDFMASFNPADHGGGKEDPDGKKFLLELLLKYPPQRNEIGQFWAALFGDKWFDRIKPLLNTASPTQAAPGTTPATGAPSTPQHADGSTP